jgi:hypothetical protein
MKSIDNLKTILKSILINWFQIDLVNDLKVYKILKIKVLRT